MFIHFSRFIHNDIQMRMIPAEVINSRGKKKITTEKHAKMQIQIIMMIMIVMHERCLLKINIKKKFILLTHTLLIAVNTHIHDTQ